MLQRAESSVALTGVEASRSFFASCFDAPRASDRLWVAHLDARARCIHLAHYDLAEGAGGPLPRREIFSDAAELESAGVILARRESEAAESQVPAVAAEARAFAQAAEALDLTVVDHLLFADGACTSFRRLGLL